MVLICAKFVDVESCKGKGGRVTQLYILLRRGPCVFANARPQLTKMPHRYCTIAGPGLSLVRHARSVVSAHETVLLVGRASETAVHGYVTSSNGGGRHDAGRQSRHVDITIASLVSLLSYAKLC
jgi:hypothetical protein